MYQKIAGTSGAGALSTLPVTGFNILGYVILAATLVAAGLALLTLAPKIARRKG